MTRLPEKRSLMVVLLSIIVFCLITFLTTLFIISPGRLKPFTDQNGQPLVGSISEKVFMKIGGVEQGMFIRGKDFTLLTNQLTVRCLKNLRD